jgi:hypothetical protein
MKRWKNLLWVALGLSGLLFVAGAVTTVPALAQAVRAAWVRDVDNSALDPVRTALLVSLETNEGYRAVDGLTVPAGKRLVIENASIWAFTTNPDKITGVWLRPKTFLSPPVYLLLDPAASEFRPLAGSNTVAAYNRTIRAYFNPGEQLTAEVFAEGSAGFKTVNIYLQGYYVSLP